MLVSLGPTYIYMCCTSSNTYIFELEHIGLDTIDHKVGKMMGGRSYDGRPLSVRHWKLDFQWILWYDGTFNIINNKGKDPTIMYNALET